jgi:hypothetical protein
MSLPIWTPAALSSEALPVSGRYWRLVEAQHHVSTLKLVDSLEEQALLEQLLEESKPALPPECAGLDYLLATPFRYGAVYVFYASERVETALAEMAFYRLLFFADSPLTPLPGNAAEYTAFAASIAIDHAIDLTRPPLSRDRDAWSNPIDYGACQSLADAARAGGLEAIIYRSVRDPREGKNLALLTARGFAAREPVERQTWRIRLSTTGVQALCEFPRTRIGFARTDFAGDPRI